MKQTWNPETYNRNARFVSNLGMPVVELLDPKPESAFSTWAVAMAS
jgi:hypothetical protein